MAEAFPTAHNHVFLGGSHERNERRTWMVIALCTLMMIAEIVGGLLLARSRWSPTGCTCRRTRARCCLPLWPIVTRRRHAQDERFSFGTGKFGDLAGYTSAIILAMIALLIGYEAVTRLIWPVADSFQRGNPDCGSRIGGQCGERAAARRRPLIIVTAIPTPPAMSTTTKRRTIRKPVPVRLRLKYSKTGCRRVLGSRVLARTFSPATSRSRRHGQTARAKSLP